MNYSYIYWRLIKINNYQNVFQLLCIILEHFSGVKYMVTMQQFLQMDMKGMVILNVLLPPFSQDYQLVTYKVGIGIAS